MVRPLMPRPLLPEPFKFEAQAFEAQASTDEVPVVMGPGLTAELFVPGIHSQGLVVSLRTPGVTLLVSLMIGDSILNSDAVLGLSVG